MFPAEPLVGDFNLSGEIEAWDIDLLALAATSENDNLEFDVNDDQSIDFLDVDALLASVGTSNGDADLNGAVEFADFLVLARSFGEAGFWSDGDFDGNGEVQFGDFLILTRNFGDSPALPAASNVPEPGVGKWLPILLLGLFRGLARASRRQPPASGQLQAIPH